MNKAQWSRFSLTAASLLTLLTTSPFAFAQQSNNLEPVREVSNIQQTGCSELEVESLIDRWRQPYLPAGAALRDCGDRAIPALTAVTNDNSLPLRTRHLTARLIAQNASDLAIDSLLAALTNDLSLEMARTDLHHIGLKGLETMLQNPDSRLTEALPEILRSPNTSEEMKLAIMSLVGLNVTRQAPNVASNTFRGTYDALIAIAADESESLSVRLNATDTLSALIYHVSGEFLVEAASLETLVTVAESESDEAIRQGAVEALMMTAYMTLTHDSCEWRWEEIAIAHEALQDLASGDRIDTLWDLGAADTPLWDLGAADAPLWDLGGAADALQPENSGDRAALQNIISTTYPRSQDICATGTNSTPGALFFDYIESKNQPRLSNLLVQWALTQGS